MATKTPTSKKSNNSVLRIKTTSRQGTKAERIAQMRREGLANARNVIIKQYPDLG
ncbi:hypothetical protein [Corynebacterium sp. LaCa116]|uniref:hypothetical protein n=1 Tax=Corynebacterium sp. LaCa116 TaxID=3391423 RepID=UPI00398977C0